MRLSGLPLIILSGIALGAFVGAELAGWSLAVNVSESMPCGLYLMGPLKHVGRGDLVAACIPKTAAAKVYADRGYLPRRGDCPSGLARVLKPIAGIAGDLVQIEAAGVAINGAVIPGSAVLQDDSAGRSLNPLPKGWNRHLGTDSYFLLSTWSPRSLDSRYFGLVTSADLVGRAWPVATW